MSGRNGVVTMLLAVAKTIVPAPLRDFLRRRPLILLQKIFWVWHSKNLRANASKVEGFESLLIIAGDPYSLMGSRGDDAMVTVAVQQARRRNPDCRIGVVSVNAFGTEGTKSLGLDIENVWSGSNFSTYLNALLRYDAVVVLGADVMDGHYYSAASALRFWMMADLAARAGKQSVVVGFSFEHPAACLKWLLDKIDPRVRICVREAVSLDCFRKFCTAKAELTSDIAFLLEPDREGSLYAAAKAWADAQRVEGRVVCAINMRPMHYIDEKGQPRKIDVSDEVVQAIADIGADAAVSYLLIPHDFRADSQSDIDSLTVINRGLSEKGSEIFFLENETTAVELKAIVSLADILLTGRMHLGIAAISQGVPVISISFQEKFKGFYQLFSLPTTYLMTPIDAKRPGSVAMLMQKGLDERHQMAELIKRALPEVKVMSAQNFSQWGSPIVD